MEWKQIEKDGRFLEFGSLYARFCPELDGFFADLT